MKQVIEKDKGYPAKISLGGTDFCIYVVVGQGDCLYDSFAYLFYAYKFDDTQYVAKETHKDMRKSVAHVTRLLHKHTKKGAVKWSHEMSKTDFMNHFTREIKEIDTPKKWGSEVAIRAFVESVNRTMNVWHKDGKSRTWKKQVFTPVTDFHKIVFEGNKHGEDAYPQVQFDIAHVCCGYPDLVGPRDRNHFQPLLPADHKFDEEGLPPSEQSSSEFIQGLDETQDKEVDQPTRIKLGASRSHVDSGEGQHVRHAATPADDR